MRKRIIHQTVPTQSSNEQNWMDLLSLAQVELTSEEADYPIEAALTPNTGAGWRAAHAGEQTIRLLFDEPQQVNHIQVLFLEERHARTQEFVLRWSSDVAQPCREIVRQQYNFSPPDVVRELEDYTVALLGVMVLELCMVPDISGGTAHASVTQLRIA